MDLIALDDASQLYLSPDIEDWAVLDRAGINVVIDLDGGVDHGIPTLANHIFYLYFPINDAALPTLSSLHAVGRFGADLIRAGNRVLSHCGLGFNRSALVAGVILLSLGLSGPEAVERICSRRQGALYNKAFRDYLLTCQPEPRV